ncbi:MAG: TlpA disulfide reductase family protein [bacterium]
MKVVKLLFSFVFFSFIVVACSGNIPKEKFSFAPEKPQPGELVTVRFNPDSTKLADLQNIKVFAYFYGKELLKTEEMELKNEDGIWKATFKTDTLTKGLVFKFTDEKEKIIDNNQNKGYFVKLYDKNGNVVPGATAGLAMCFADWGYYADLETDRELAYSLFNEEFAKNSSLKTDYLETYLFLINRLDSQHADSLINEELSRLELLSNLDEKNIALMVNWFTKFKNEKAKTYEQFLKEKFPKAEYFQNLKYKEFRTATIENKIKLADEFEKEFSNPEMNVRLYNAILAEYVNAKKYNEAKMFIDKNKDKISIYRFYTTADKLLADSVDINLINEIVKIGVEKAAEDLINPKDKNPEYYSDAQWKKDREAILGLNKSVLARVQFKLGQNDVALENINSAYILTRGQDVDVNMLFSKELIKKGKFAQAKGVLEEDIKLGQGNNETEELLKEAYTKDKTNKESFEKYFAGLKAAANAELLEKIKKDLVNLPAPDFTLLDVNGKTVTLNEFKGKVVILDFWATWCGPCMSSFPGMKTVVEKYAKDPNVVVLFVNSWENVENKLQNAKDFLAKTKYPFRVLMDEKNKVVESFKITGIPTKIFIDKTGKVRFKSVGFGGNADEMVKEIDMIINLIK